ncbi:Hemin uptake protein HemP [Tranquillimonas rosea]|uniref:Hemin uptake protein HemP n=1 Tax=Tranquillimonas rosea TaxID=641238 RepID=A0A1H9PFX3_9RHOB|nr:Hemin uptake protein HemP [Tranquillimonas rosea]
MTHSPDPQVFHASASDMPTYDARSVTGAGTQARILLDGQTYYLRITKAGKLILTK